MENRIRETQQKRFQFLLKLFEESQGDKLFSIDAFELGDQLGYSRDETNRIDDYLRGEELVQGVAGTRISITHRGIVEVEKALSNPNEPTTYFPPIGARENKEEIIANIPIKNSFDTNRYLYQFFPTDSEVTFFIGSHLLVEHDQFVVLYKNGRPCDVFHKGEHIISRKKYSRITTRVRTH